MKKPLQILMVILVLLIGLIGGAVSARMVPQTDAQRNDRPAPRRPDRWEYCSLSRAMVGESRAGVYWITYFRGGSAQITEFEDQATDRYAMAKAIAKLGDEGWEMVSEAPLEIRGGKLSAIYFKRLRP